MGSKVEVKKVYIDCRNDEQVSKKKLSFMEQDFSLINEVPELLETMEFTESFL